VEEFAEAILTLALVINSLITCNDKSDEEE
jgi:uncharacterized lipoprotein NlpE involved in copper resistance